MSSDRLHSLIDSFLERSYAFSPHYAAYIGLHQYDGQAMDMRRETIERRVADLRDSQSKLATIDRASLPKSDQFDLDLALYSIGEEMYDLTIANTAAESPTAYALFDVSNYIKRNYAPKNERVRRALTYLQNSLPLLEQAKQNLNGSLSRIRVQVALQVFGGFAVYYAADGEFFSDLGEVGADVLTEAKTVTATVNAALTDFVVWLQGKEADATNEFALGHERYSQYMRYHELVEMTPEEMLRVGEANLARNKARMQALLAQEMPGVSVADAIKELGKHHPTADSLIPETRAMLERIRTFLIDHAVITIPSEVRCTVEQTPPYYPAEAFASMDTPGPFESVATEAFYYVNGPKREWSPEKQEEWLTTFAYTNLEDVSIHEAYPGHYVQLLHMQNAPSKIAKSVYNYAFVEGWAHYCEQMMIVDEQYGDGNPKLEIAQLLEALVRNVRFVDSVAMHTQGMTVAQATQRFEDDAYLSHASAEAEATRGTYDPGYFAYTLGKLQILKLREDYKAEQGDAYSLRDFHDTLLAFGSPPVALIRRQMLQHDSGVML